MLTPEALGRRIRAARAERAHKPEFLAVALGVSADTIGRWERGVGKGPTFVEVARLANALGLSVEWFAGDGDRDEVPA